MTSPLDNLTAALRSTDPQVRASAAESFAQLGPEAQAAAPLLVAACDADDDALEWITAALEDLGPPRVDDLTALTQLLHDKSLDRAYWAATLIGRTGPAGAPAATELATALKQHGEMAVRERAAWALGQIGPGAAAALPALRQAAEGGSARLKSLATTAIKQIGG